jgi:hypothetical protein
MRPEAVGRSGGWSIRGRATGGAATGVRPSSGVVGAPKEHHHHGARPYTPRRLRAALRRAGRLCGSAAVLRVGQLRGRPGPAVPLPRLLPAPSTFRPRAPPQSAVGTTAVWPRCDPSAHAEEEEEARREPSAHSDTRVEETTLRACGATQGARARVRTRMRARASSNPRRGILVGFSGRG